MEILENIRSWKVYLFVFLIMSIYPLTFFYTKKSIKNQNIKNNETQPSVLSEGDDNQESGMIESEVESVSESNNIPGVSINRNIDFGVSVNNYIEGGEISSLENLLSESITTVSIFKHFGGSNSNLSESDLAYLKGSGKKLLIAWEPRNPELGVQDRDYLIDIQQGNFDSYILDFASKLESYGNPVTIRFGHEMNGDWYPWGRRPEEYIAAYRKVVDTIRSGGFSNIDFMWCINAESSPPENISNTAKYYPGDSYVDIIGIDGFNFGESQNWSKWRSFSEIFAPPYNFLVNTYNKPIMIAETASAEIGGNKPEWVNDMFFQLNTNFTKIDEIVWFSILKEADWRINSTDSSLNAFKINLQ